MNSISPRGEGRRCQPSLTWVLVCSFLISLSFSTQAQNWYLPIDNSAFGEPAVNAATAPSGYFLAPDQACVQMVVDADSYCVNTDWDNICQNAYNDCAYGGGCEWYIPNTPNSGPAVWACSAPADYYLANENCAQIVINNDPYCVNSFWDTICQDAYCTCADPACTDPTACNFNPTACTDDGSCVYGYWYLPNTIGGGTAVFTCTAPADYFFADQACAQTVIDADPFCVNNTWDGLCQNSYNDCLYGDGCDWYLPLTVSAGPAVWACSAPVDYFFANQECAQTVITGDPYCVNNLWDTICQDAYCACATGCTDPAACNYDSLACTDDGSCTYTQWYIPDTVTGPAVFDCVAPLGYILADQACAQSVVDNDPFCVNTIWDSLCQTAYDCCLNETFGCTDFFACNYDPAACTDDGSCTYPGCTDVDACNYDATAGCDDGSCIFPQWYIPDTVTGPAIFDCAIPAGYILADQACAQSVVDNDPFCVDSIWDSICQQAYDCCINDTNGCTDPAACNFDSAAVCNDGSCTYPGCTYPNACNYNASAGCEDGSCLFVDECGNCGGSDTAGCIDPGADNYDPTASCDDGSCFIAGCTYLDATNYNGAATIDDGSCSFPAVNNCPEDLNLDGVVNAADLLQFLGAFGTVCPQ